MCLHTDLKTTVFSLVSECFNGRTLESRKASDSKHRKALSKLMSIRK